MAHASLRGTKLLVPLAARERAQALLDEADFGGSPHRPTPAWALAGVQRLKMRGLALMVVGVLGVTFGVGYDVVVLFTVTGLGVILLMERRQE